MGNNLLGLVTPPLFSETALLAITIMSILLLSLLKHVGWLEILKALTLEQERETGLKGSLAAPQGRERKEALVNLLCLLPSHLHFPLETGQLAALCVAGLCPSTVLSEPPYIFSIETLSGASSVAQQVKSLPFREKGRDLPLAGSLPR